MERASKVSDRTCILDQGEVVHRGDAVHLLADKEIQERYRAV